MSLKVEENVGLPRTQQRLVCLKEVRLISPLFSGENLSGGLGVCQSPDNLDSKKAFGTPPKVFLWQDEGQDQIVIL